MKLIWTKSGLPLSKMITLGLNEPVSHFGIVFDNGIVFHSNLIGTHVEWFGTFVKKCQVVFEKTYEMTLEAEEQVFQNILSTYDDLGYDFGAFFYFIYRGLLFRFFNIAFPKRNAWQSGDKFLCTELASVLPDSIVPSIIKTQDLSIISPYKLYLQIQ